MAQAFLTKGYLNHSMPVHDGSYSLLLANFYDLDRYSLAVFKAGVEGVIDYTETLKDTLVQCSLHTDATLAAPRRIPSTLQHQHTEH